MSQKPILTLYTPGSISNLPVESAVEFKTLVLENRLTPSVALRRIMAKYDCNTLDLSIPIQLLTLTYPNLDLDRNGFRSRLVDADYPNSGPEQFSDQDFDEGIAELLAIPEGA